MTVELQELDAVRKLVEEQKALQERTRRQIAGIDEAIARHRGIIAAEEDAVNRLSEAREQLASLAGTAATLPAEPAHDPEPEPTATESGEPADGGHPEPAPAAKEPKPAKAAAKRKTASRKAADHDDKTGPASDAEPAEAAADGEPADAPARDDGQVEPAVAGDGHADGPEDDGPDDFGTEDGDPDDEDIDPENISFLS